jgi:hypothetical protein
MEIYYSVEFISICFSFFVLFKAMNTIFWLQKQPL